MPDDPNETRTSPPDVPPTAAFDPRLDAGLAAAYGSEPTPGGWSQPPLLRDDPSENATVVQSGSPEMPRGSDDRYQLLGEIARGGMGVVLKGRDPDLGRDLAFKVLRTELAGKPAAVQRFVEEAQVGGQLQHPGVVPVYDIGRFTDGRPYFAMKLVKGRTLADLLAERPDPSADRGKFLQVFLQICQTVAYAHSKGVIHRDLKPSNVMVGAFGEVLVMDWGLAKVLARGGVADEVKASSEHERPTDGPTEIKTVRFGGGSETAAGSVMGTPAFMPPEQAGGEIDKLDERADVFGLGAVLCVVLTGKPPFAARDADAVRLMAIRGDLAAALSRLDGCGADAELIDLCKRCLSHDRDARPRQAGAVATAVAAHLAGVEDRARRAELDRAAAEARAAEEANTRRVAEEKAAEERKRRRVQLALAASLLVLVAVGGSGAWWVQRQVTERNESDVVRRLEQARTQERERLGTATALTQASDLRKRGLWQPAEVVIQQALDALGSDADPELRNQLELGRRHARFAARLDGIQRINPEPNSIGRGPPPNEAYVILNEMGFDMNGPDLADLARRVAAHPLRDELVAALDFIGGSREWTVAARATGQMWRLELLEVLNDAGRLKARAEKLDISRASPSLLLAISQRLPLRDKVPLLRRACEQYPADFWLHYTTAENLRSGLEPNGERMSYLRAALALRPGSAAAWGELGWCYREMGDVDREIGARREALRIEPKEEQERTVLGDFLRTTGRVDEAIAVFSEGLRIDPSNPARHAQLARALRDKGEFEKAIAGYQEAIRIGPKNVSYRNDLASTLRETGESDKAIAVYQEVLRTDAQELDSRVGLADTFGQKGEPHKAIAVFQEAIRNDPNDMAVRNALGRWLQSAGRLSEAVVAYREAVRLVGKNSPLHYTDLATALSLKGEPDEAIAVLNEATWLIPFHTEYFLGRTAEILWLKGEFDASIAASKKAVQLAEYQHLKSAHLVRVRKAELWKLLSPRLQREAPEKITRESPAQALEFARSCMDPLQRRYLLGTQLLTAVFAADPEVADDLKTHDRYNAACSAALAAAGKDRTVTTFGAEEWGCLTDLAYQWLRADLAASAVWAKDPVRWPDVQRRLRHWKQDTDLVAVRDPAWVAAMPPADRTRWESLWVDVNTLLATARPTVAPGPVGR